MLYILIPVLGLLCLTPFISSGMALLMGVALALTLGNPFLEHTRKLTHILLSLAIVGMGAGMNLEVVGKAGLQGIGYTIAGISAALLLGFGLKHLYKIETRIATLITVGTAICGGSAIAAIAPVIRAKHHEISVALGTVFVLNAVALLVFPPLGHALNLTQNQFGLWSALAIHDTSSVVGAAMQYGPDALQIGTTVKLARALWIVPLAFIFSHLYRHQVAEDGQPHIKKPWFILGFCLAAALVTWVPNLQPAGHLISTAAKHVLVLTLYLIGLNLTRDNLKQVGIRPFLHGVTLWVLVAAGTLGAIQMHVIQ